MLQRKFYGLLISNRTAGSVTMPEDPYENVEEWWRRSLSSLSQSKAFSSSCTYVYHLEPVEGEEQVRVQLKKLATSHCFEEVLLRRVAYGQPAVE